MADLTKSQVLSRNAQERNSRERAIQAQGPISYEQSSAQIKRHRQITGPATPKANPMDAISEHFEARRQQQMEDFHQHVQANGEQIYQAKMEQERQFNAAMASKPPLPKDFPARLRALNRKYPRTA